LPRRFAAPGDEAGAMTAATLQSHCVIASEAKQSRNYNDAMGFFSGLLHCFAVRNDEAKKRFRAGPQATFRQKNVFGPARK
jgi:hypothetical protein